MKKFILTLLLFCFSIVPANAKSVLVILSGESTLILKNGKRFETGFYLNELMIPVMKLIENNYKLVFASPEGKIPSLDKSSDDPKYFANEREYKEAKELLGSLKILDKKNSPVVSLRQIRQKGIEEFTGLFVPGGHAPMVDLYKDRDLGKILKSFHESSRPTALVCHGPVALLSAMDKESKNKKWPYKNYKMTVFSNDEEHTAETKKLKGKVPFYPEDALSKAGGKLLTRERWKANVVVDRELITGQNPASDRELAEIFIKKMKKMQ